MRRLKQVLKITLILVTFIIGVALLFVAYVHFFVSLDPPSIDSKLMKHNAVVMENDARILQDNWLRLDSTGIWEMYIEGSPFERGQAVGLLCEDLLDYQEKVFVKQVEELVPNRLYRNFLLHAIQYYNRNLDHYIVPEYREEIYGVSLSAPKQFEHLGSNYERKLTYHGAHDIGHAFQNMGFISGCTAIAALDSLNGDLLLGRNFDFYVGDEFARNKIVACIRPDSGFAFVSLTWAGMMGIVSGMNDRGLAVVLNAGPSEMPKGARTPVTLIGREIIQYAETIEEAVHIAKKTRCLCFRKFHRCLWNRTSGRRDRKKPRRHRRF